MRYAASTTSIALILFSFATGQAIGQDATAAASEIVAKYKEAFNAGKAADVAALYTEDAVALGPNADRMEGREAITGLLSAQIDQMGASNLEITPDETGQLGEAIYQTGTYSMNINGPQGMMPVNGDWLSVAEKTADGNYLIKRHIWNIDLPPMQ